MKSLKHIKSNLKKISKKLKASKRNVSWIYLKQIFMKLIPKDMHYIPELKDLYQETKFTNT
ncbi:hypothetical protein VY93_00720 [Mycoplasmopsis synoviae ATCC 25204]|nr:hypothetical protein VY93_00720 [Mycoplasmopsis synoviae ATCC 25204]